MDQGIYTAAAGARAMEENLALVSHNLANAGTSGFKKDALAFEQYIRLLDTTPLASGQYQWVPVDVLAESPFIDTTPGPLRETANPLDLAVTGEGFFVVNTLDGERYTRAGAFQLSMEGVLVNAHGDPVQGEGGDLPLGGGTVSVETDGTVVLDGRVVDVLRVVDIPPEALIRGGDGMFAVQEGFVPAPVEALSVRQGSLELSNVEPIREMVGLITTQRAYEAFQKVIKSFSDTYSLSIRNVGVLA